MAAETLSFAVREGANDNRFFRRGQVAAHLCATSGTVPRILFALPAGNTGAALWFDHQQEPVEVTIEDDLVPVEAGAMRGVSVSIRFAARELVVRGAVLGSVRALRAFPRDGEATVGFCRTEDPGPSVTLARTTVDGHHRVELRIVPQGAAVAWARDDGRIAMTAPPGETLRVTFTALTDHAPLTPIPLSEILAPRARRDGHAARVLAFLSYEEKLLAGSWRFLTYFGRDTLLALRLLMPVLESKVLEAGLGSVLDRLSPEGAVAHEEAIGNWTATPQHPGALVLDHSMVDDDFLLAPVAVAYLLDGHGRARARDFLARRTPAGVTYAAALAQNLALVLRRAAPFAVRPSASTLVALAPDHAAGEWRDSDDGLGGGRIPFDVNAALVPAALAAAARLQASGLLGEEEPTHAGRLAIAWRRAIAHFHVRIEAAEARRRVAAYADMVGIDPAPALASLRSEVTFPALSLRADGAPIPVMHTDDGFVLLFMDPTPAYLEEAAARIVRPFPAGLRTPAGLVVANPAFADDRAIHARFTPAHYHGTVVWSWHHALLAGGVRRQLARADLPPRTRARLEEADRVLSEVIETSRGWETSELWSIAAREGRLERVPFGAARAHHDEANAAQLWSTVFLGLGA
jgi:hypothetical protein